MIIAQNTENLNGRKWGGEDTHKISSIQGWRANSVEKIHLCKERKYSTEIRQGSNPSEVSRSPV